eukprot:215134_1
MSKRKQSGDAENISDGESVLGKIRLLVLDADMKMRMITQNDTGAGNGPPILESFLPVGSATDIPLIPGSVITVQTNGMTYQFALGNSASWEELTHQSKRPRLTEPERPVSESLSPGEQMLGSHSPGDQMPGPSSPGDQVPGSRGPGDQMPGSPSPGEQMPESLNRGDQVPGSPEVRSASDETKDSDYAPVSETASDDDVGQQCGCQAQP